MTQLITLASLNRPLTCAEFDSNNQALTERANHTGTQLSSTISDFGARVDGLPTIVALQLCCSDLTASIATLRDDIFGSGDLNALLTALEARVVNQINALAAVVGNQQDQITTLTLDISSIIANIQALTTSTSSLQAQITALTAVVTTKAPINSPALTGTPTSTTPLVGDSSTHIATTAFVAASIFPATDTSFGTVRTNTFDATPIVYRKQEVDSLLSNFAPLNSPQFNGIARIAPGSEPPSSANDNKIPTTAWVRSYLSTNSTSVPLASSAAPGILKSYSNSSDPITYLKDDVDGLLSSKAPIASPTFTGSVTIPNASITGTSTIGNVTLQGSADLTTTPPVSDNSTKIANTSWVVQYVTGITAPPIGSSGEESQTPILMSRFSGSYSTQRRAAINTLIKTLKSNGIYQVLDRLFIFTSPLVADAMQNWIVEYNNAASFSGPADRHIAEIGLTEGSATVSGINTLTNCKPYNLSMLVDNWTKSSNISSISGGSGVGFTAGPFFNLNANVGVNTTVTPDVLEEEGSFSIDSQILAGAAPSLTSSFFDSGTGTFNTAASFPSSTPFAVGASINGRALTTLRNGIAKSYGAAISALPDWPAINAIITTGSGGFCTHAAIGGYLTAAKQQILSEAIHNYVSNQLASTYRNYLT